MELIRKKPGDPPIHLVLQCSESTRLYRLCIGRKGKLSAQLQEVKTPEREAILAKLKRS